jgi:hypothetical protein
MKITAEDISILHAALLVVLQGDEDLWDELTVDEMDRANALFARLEAKVLDDGYEDDDGVEDDEDSDDDDDGEEYDN